MIIRAIAGILKNRSNNALMATKINLNALSFHLRFRNFRLNKGILATKSIGKIILITISKTDSVDEDIPSRLLAKMNGSELMKSAFAGVGSPIN